MYSIKMEVENKHCVNQNGEHDLIHRSSDKENSCVVKNSSCEEIFQNEIPQVLSESNSELTEANTVEENVVISNISTEEVIVENSEITETESIEESEIVETENDMEGIVGAEGGEMNENADKNPDRIVQRLTRLPVSRIKSIMKFDDDVHMATQEATFLVTKATELFINSFMKEVHQCTLASKKKTISKRDVDTAIFSKDCFMFLDGALD